MAKAFQSVEDEEKTGQSLTVSAATQPFTCGQTVSGCPCHQRDAAEVCATLRRHSSRFISASRAASACQLLFHSPLVLNLMVCCMKRSCMTHAADLCFVAVSASASQRQHNS